MTTHPDPFLDLRTLPKSELLSRTASLAAEERRITVELLRHLREVDRRKLTEEAGYSGIFEYCVKVLKLSDGSAFRRVQAMRALRDGPDIGEALLDGRLNVTTASQIQTFLQRAKRAGLSPKEIQSRLVRSDEASERPASGSPTSEEIRERVPNLFESLSGLPSREVERRLSDLAPEIPRAERERSVSETEIEIRVTISNETRAKWKRIQALAAHRLRFDSSTRRLIELTTDLSLETLEKGKNRPASPPGSRSASVAKAPSDPETSGPPSGHEAAFSFVSAEARRPDLRTSRTIPAALRRTVWKRDGGRCRYGDPETGRFCESRFGLEIDHIRPWSRGGSSTDPENLRLLCAAHHRLVTERTFGTPAEAPPQSPHDGRGPSI